MEIVDYRNGKYQGSINFHRQRHGTGILIDDDLLFAASHWHHNELQGPTLLYLAHGQYMYGQWKRNQPQGLNIFRAADTVLLADFQNGTPSGRCLLILERQNLAWVLDVCEDEWKVLEGGPLPNHKVLLQYLQSVGLRVPDHFFSLTKFICSFSQQSKHIKTYPCGSSNCYFGFVQGLAIVFNHNNAVISVGQHQNQQLCEFGGKFEGQTVTEGNFQPDGEVITYRGVRPASQIRSIFNNLHQRSAHFENSYIEPKHKLYGKVETALREKVQEIASLAQNQHIANINSINDSLDFREVVEEQESMSQKRKQMYSPIKTPEEKTQTKTRTQSDFTEQKPIHEARKLNVSPSQFIKQEQNLKKPGSHRLEFLAKEPKQPSGLLEEPRLVSEFSRKVYLEKNSNGQNKQVVKIEEESQKSPTFKGFIEQMQSKYKIGGQNINHKEKIYQEVAKGSTKTKTQREQKPQEKESENLSAGGHSPSRKKFDITAIPRPSYEEIEERRKRVLKEFKELNRNPSQDGKTFQKPTQNQDKRRKQSTDSSFGYIPLSISQKNGKLLTPSRQQLQNQDKSSSKSGNVRKPVQGLGSAPANQNHLDKHSSVLAKSFQKLLQSGPGSRKKVEDDESAKVQNGVIPSQQKRTYVYLFE